MIDKEIIKKRFSKSAKSYDQYANVQKYMGDHLLEKIKREDIKPERILEIGCGTGYVTKALLQLFPQAKITAVDIAPGMIAYMRDTLQNKNLKLVCADIEEIELQETYDLIVSNATFQWFNSLEDTLNKLVNSIAPNGILLFSTFGKDTFRELHQSFQIAKESLNIDYVVSPGQSFYSLSELKKIYAGILNQKNASLSSIELEETYFYEYFRDCKDFLQSVKKIGANNAQKEKNKPNIHFIKKVIEAYDCHYRQEDKVVATYHSLFGCIRG